MTVCRYFLQGNCRFGDRCRFEHTENNSYNYNNRAYGNQRDNYNRQEEIRNHRYNDQYSNQDFETLNRYYVYQRGYSSDKYSENYRSDSSQKYSSGYGGYDNQYNNNYNRGYEQQPRYNNTNSGKNQQYRNNYQSESGQNRFRWLSEDYAQQQQQREVKSNYRDEAYDTSTPKGKVPFSFKLPASEIKKESVFTSYKVDEQDQLHSELVKEDAKQWELGGQWPFSCYFPCTDKYGFPGFSDISPEELRFAAYKAEENNSYESYVKSVQDTLSKVKELRSQLQVPTPQLLATLRRLWKGENLCSSTANASIPFIQCEEMATDTMDAPSISSVPNTAAGFSFKMATETNSTPATAFKVSDDLSKSSAAAFSFKVTPTSELKSSVTASDGDTEIYTPLESLTEEEKEQFSASTFILGKIPTRPPPQMFCA